MESINKIFSDLPHELISHIFTFLPVNFIEQLYYDKISKNYWMGFPLRLTHHFWLNKARAEFNISEIEFNSCNIKGYYRYAEIVSRQGLCKHSIRLIRRDLYVLRAAKHDNLDLFVEVLNGKKLSYDYDFMTSVVNIAGPKVLSYCINNKIIDKNIGICNSNLESVKIIRGTRPLTDNDLLKINLLNREIDGVADLAYKRPEIFRSNKISKLIKILQILPIDVISKILRHQENLVLCDFIDNITCQDHICNYDPNKLDGHKINSFRKMLLWAKTGRICCIISHIQSGNNSEIFLKHLLPFLTEDDLNTIMSQCDTSGFNSIHTLIRYPNLLYQHKNWQCYSLDFKDKEEFHNLIIYKDNLENYRKLICISKELGFPDIPIIDYSTEISRLS